MTPEIKERIEQIRHGNVPEGYIENYAGIIPDSWTAISLGNIGEAKNGLNFHRDDEGYKVRVLGVGDFKDKTVMRNLEGLTEISLSTAPDAECFLQNGDIVFVRSNGSKELVGRNLLVFPHDLPVSYSGFCIRYRMNDLSLTSPEYLNFILDSGVLKKKLQKENQGSNISNLNQDILSELTIVLPIDKGEQASILQILDSQNKVIELKEKLLAEKQRQKKYLMQQLLTGKKRLPGFEGEWKKVTIGSFIREIDERTTENNQHDILSVTKNGIVRQSDHFNKQIASEDNTGYKILRRGNLAFSSMNLWMGSLDVLEDYEVGIISPAYKVFSFNTQLMNIKFGRQFMRSESMIWQYKVNSEQGASIVRRNLDLKALLSTKVSIPGLDEQQAIATVFMAADREIELLQQGIECEKKKKKALMQLLLTGIVRVTAE